MTPSVPPCAVCTFLKRKCTNDCMFAPYFPPDQPEKFADMAKLLMNDLPPLQRENVPNSLVYGAESSLKDSVYGNVDLVAKQLPFSSQPQAFIPQQQMHPRNPSSSAAMLPYNMSPMPVIPAGAPTQGGQLEIREPGIQSQHREQIFVQQQILRAYDLAVSEQQELLRTYESQQPLQKKQKLQQPLKPMSFNGGFDPTAAGGSNQLFEAQQLEELFRTYKLLQHPKPVSFNGGLDPAATGGSNQLFEAQQLFARKQQEHLRTYELQQQLESMSFNGGFDLAAAGGSNQLFEAQQLTASGQQEILQTYEQPQQSQLMSFNGGFNPAEAGGSSQHQSFEAQQLAAAPVAAREQQEILQPYEERLLEHPSQLQTQQWEPNDYNLLTQLQKLDEHNQRAQLLIDEKRKGKRVADH
ncbi:hypothetical protein FH972_003980 [Carpinus fangiana]|uniref:LOB domain-containing protein n=1 Tax=Carpinus fangiana TaxID=176857 RepID=A0A5N6QJQ3_9ROSI|nr:hypothetical protein FH972_003980 [Carpinus fangiana]